MLILNSHTGVDIKYMISLGLRTQDDEHIEIKMVRAIYTISSKLSIKLKETMQELMLEFP